MAFKNVLEQLKEVTTIVADTGDFEAIERLKPTDATTNPTLIMKASQNDAYQPLIQEAITYARNEPTLEARKRKCMDRLVVSFGREILKKIPGRVSTEVDARLSFDTDETIRLARALIRLYESEGIARGRILIKIASTWEGLLAAKTLEAEGIHCNMTLMFSFVQAVGAGEFGVKLISPFVGRIYDWYKKQGKLDETDIRNDPGILSVRKIHHYYKQKGYLTEIMGASFRNIKQIIALGGTDLLTISPSLLNELNTTPPVHEPFLLKHEPVAPDIPPLIEPNIHEKTFRWLMNEDAMATEKLAEGIRIFAADTVKLENTLIEQGL